MTIPPQAAERAAELANAETGDNWVAGDVLDFTFGPTFVRYIADVSEACKAVDAKLQDMGLSAQGVRTLLAPFILAEPVDPLLIEARKLAADNSAMGEHYRGAYMAGGRDAQPMVKAIYAALRRGMELAKAGEA